VILSVSPPSASMTAPATTRLFASGVESKAETTQRGWTRTVICVDRRRRAAVRCRQRSVPLPPSQCR
jgi:hypothetical protein